MKNIRLVSLKRNENNPVIGDLCLTHQHGLFFWTQKHVDNESNTNDIDYYDIQVVTIAVVNTEKESFEVGEDVITSNWKLDKVSMKYDSGRYATKEEDYSFESYQIYSPILLDVVKVYERVFSFDEETEIVQVSLKELDLAAIVSMMRKENKRGDFCAKIETKAGEIKLVDGCIIINKQL